MRYKYYFVLSNNKTYQFNEYEFAESFYEDNKLDIIDTNFRYWGQ